MTDSSEAPATQQSTSAEPAVVPNLAAATLAAARAKLRGEPTASVAGPIGIALGVAAAAVLLLVVVIIALSRSSGTANKSSPATAIAATSPPPAPGAVADAEAPAPTPTPQPGPAPAAKPLSAFNRTMLQPNADAAAAPAAAPKTATVSARTVPAAVEGPRPLGAGLGQGSQSTQPLGARPQPAQPQVVSPQWAEVWRLPAESSSAAEPLASIESSESAWTLAVRGSAMEVRGGADVVVEPDQAAGSQSWILRHLSQTSAGNEPIGALRREGSTLLFSWLTPPASSGARGAVANCVVEITAGAEKRAGQLREPLRTEPIALDLTAEEQIVELHVADLPRMDAVRLEITELSGFSSEAKFRGGMKSMAASRAPAGSPSSVAQLDRVAQPLGSQQLGGQPFGAQPLGARPLGGLSPGVQALGPQGMVLEFADIPGLEVRVRCERAEENGNLAFSIDPVFRENGSDFDLRSPKRLERLETDVQRPLANAKQDLAPAKKLLARSQSEEEKHKANEPPSSNQKRVQGWQKKHRELTQSIAKYESEVKSQTEKIDAYEARLAAVAKIHSFIQDSDKKARLRFILYLECGQPDVLLVDGRGSR